MFGILNNLSSLDICSLIKDNNVKCVTLSRWSQFTLTFPNLALSRVPESGAMWVNRSLRHDQPSQSHQPGKKEKVRLK